MNKTNKIEQFIFGLGMGIFIIPLILYFGIKRWWEVINLKEDFK